MRSTLIIIGFIYLCFNKTKPLSIPTLPSAFSCMDIDPVLSMEGARHAPTKETVA